MTTRHIALVPEMGVNASELARVSAALQKQITRDLTPIWGIAATVDAFPNIEDVPMGYWPLVLTYRDLRGAAGIHIDASGQPYALVEMSPSWSLTASHVCLEMLSDPFGNRMFAGMSPRSDQGQVEFLAGICDPCEDAQYAYVVNDVLVADFCTPSFFEPASSRERYSFTGALQAPLEVLPGGHLRWFDPATGTWWTRRLADGAIEDKNLGRGDPTKSTLREFLDARAPHHLLSTKMSIDAFEARMGNRRRHALQASQSRAFALRASLGQPRPETGDDEAVPVVRSGGRSQVFGALVRSSVPARDPQSSRSPLPPEVANGEARPPVGLPETVSQDDVEELAGPPTPAYTTGQPAMPYASARPHRTVPPPMPTTSQTPAPMPTASQPPAPGPAPVLSQSPLADRSNTMAPASLAPVPLDANSTRNRIIAIAAVAAAFVFAVSIERIITDRPSISPAAAAQGNGLGPPANAALANAGAPPVASPPVVPPVAAPKAVATVTPLPGATVTPPPAATVQVAPPASSAVPEAAPRAAAPAQPAPFVRAAIARPRSGQAAVAPRATRAPEAKSDDSLEDLIDDRR